MNKIFVNFDLYCDKCVHSKLNEVKDPCNMCLDESVNDDTDAPVYFEEKKGDKNAASKRKLQKGL